MLILCIYEKNNFKTKDYFEEILKTSYLISSKEGQNFSVIIEILTNIQKTIRKNLFIDKKTLRDKSFN